MQEQQAASGHDQARLRQAKQGRRKMVGLLAFGLVFGALGSIWLAVSPLVLGMDSKLSSMVSQVWWSLAPPVITVGTFLLPYILLAALLNPYLGADWFARSARAAAHPAPQMVRLTALAAVVLYYPLWFVFGSPWLQVAIFAVETACWSYAAASNRRIVGSIGRVGSLVVALVSSGLALLLIARVLGGDLPRL